MADGGLDFSPLTPEEQEAAAQETAPGGESHADKPTLPPADAEAPEAAAARLYRQPPDGLWRYPNAAGALAFCACRWNGPNGAKDIRPLSWIDGEGWRFKHWPDGRPLYNANQIAANPEAPIVVTEGEKAADAAARIFPKSIATTSSGGGGAAHKTDWTPLAGRRVLIWPDNDVPGGKYARDVGALLAALNCKVSILDPAALFARAIEVGFSVAEKAAGYDAVDALADWPDAAQLRETAAGLAAPLDAGPATCSPRSEPLPLAPPIPPARPYPVAALGSILRGATESIAAKCQCAPALAAQSVLAVASLAAQRLADVRLPFGQSRPLSLYFVTVAASGDRKSTADNEALIPVRMYERDRRDDYRKAFNTWRIEHAAWAAQHRKIENAPKLDRAGREAELIALGSAPVEPVKPMLTAPEPTVEALAKYWPVLPGALGLFSSEGGQMTGGHGFGPDHRLKTAAALSTLWDGSGIRRLRAGDGITDLPGRRLALHLMVQPDAAAAFLSEPILRNQGLLSRLLIAAPETLAGSRAWREPSAGLDGAMRRYTAVILDLLERPAPASNEAGNELTPHTLDLSADAKSAWIVFYNRIEAEMATDKTLEGLRDVAGKAAENAARVAGVLAIIENPHATIVEPAAMANACELMAWYVGEALRLSGQHRQPAALRNAGRLLDWLRVRGAAEISLRDIMRTGPNPVRGKAEAEAALAKLDEHGWLVKQRDGRGARWTVVSEAAP